MGGKFKFLFLELSTIFFSPNIFDPRSVEPANEEYVDMEGPTPIVFKNWPSQMN